MSTLTLGSRSLADHYNDCLHDIKLHNQVTSGITHIVEGAAGIGVAALAVGAGFAAISATGGAATPIVEGVVAPILITSLPTALGMTGIGLAELFSGLTRTEVDTTKGQTALKLANPVWGLEIAALIGAGVDPTKVAEVVEGFELALAYKDYKTAYHVIEKVAGAKTLFNFMLDKILEKELADTANACEPNQSIDFARSREPNACQKDDTIGDKQEDPDANGKW
jgi:hypothetical protein